MAAAEVIAVLRANTAEFTAKMDEAEAKIVSVSKAGGSNFEKMGKAAQVGGQVAAVAILAVGAAAVDLADKYDAAQAQLKAAATGSGASFKNVQAQATAADDGMAKFGYTAAQVESATATLTIAQGKHVDVQKDLTLAANIASARHIDLASAIGLVNKAAAGNTGALKRMGIDLPIVAGGSAKVTAAQTALSKAQEKVNDDVAAGANSAAVGSKANNKLGADVLALAGAHKTLTAAQQAGTNVLDALSQRFGGQAAASAETMGGKLKAMKAQAENLGTTLGEKLLPVLEKLITGISKLVEWFEKHKAAAVALGIALAALAVGLIAVSIAGAIMEATFSPVIAIIIAVIAAVALLAFAIYELREHWKTVWSYIGPIVHDVWDVIRPIFELLKQWFTIELKVAIDILRTEFQIAWTLISTAVQLAWNGFIKPTFDLIKAGINDIKTVIGVLSTIWSGIWNGIGAAVQVVWANVIKPAWDILKGGITDVQTVMSGLGTAWSTIWNGLGAAVTSAYNTYIKPAVDVVTGAVNAVKSAWDAIFGGGGSAPAKAAPPSGAQINHAGRATGGPVSALSTYLVGENGPELFTPQSNGTIIPNGVLSNNAGITPFGGTGSGGDTQVVLNLVLNGQSVGQALLPSLQTAVLQAQRGLSVPVFGTVQ